ncbi:amino acid ABC transporter permease, partial [Pseudomonas sp. MWU12-2312b]
MHLDFTVVFSYWQALLQGLALTLVFTVGCAIMGSLCGFLLSLLRASRRRWLSVPAGLYVELFRGTPLLIQLFWVFFCFPVVFGIDIAPYVSVLLALTLYMTAITSETFRGALKSIPGEQHDACVALGLASWNKTVFVVFPQALLRGI